MKIVVYFSFFSILLPTSGAWNEQAPKRRMWGPVQPRFQRQNAKQTASNLLLSSLDGANRPARPIHPRPSVKPRIVSNRDEWIVGEMGRHPVPPLCFVEANLAEHRETSNRSK